ncbi:MAG: hypothetical protein IJ774_12890 [Selenomonadaceae bacterium]|nr:hypothetical protein [Selenomonadaceae bacterium]
MELSLAVEFVFESQARISFASSIIFCSAPYTSPAEFRYVAAKIFPCDIIAAKLLEVLTWNDCRN